MELYDCASTILGLRDNLVERWSDETNKTIHLGASTIPAAYILPEVLPEYGKDHPEICFIINQSDSQGVSIVSERAARNFSEEGRLLIFEFPENVSGRNLYLVYRKNDILSKYIQKFLQFINTYYLGRTLYNKDES